MKKFFIVALVLFFGSFTQPLMAYYPCGLLHPGEIGNCEGCGELSPTDCHRDCTPTWSGYSCSQIKNGSICAPNTTYYNSVDACSCPTNTTKDFLYGGYNGFSCTPICEINIIYSNSINYANRCECPRYTTTRLSISSTNSSQLDSYKCVPNTPDPFPPQPQPITYCTLNQEYSFGVTPSVKQCTCPYGSHLVESLGQMVGVHRFTCVSDYIPQPTPSPVYCWDGSVVYNGNSCPQYKYCSNDGKKYPLSYSCYVQPIVYQTCLDGSVIPSTSVCPTKTICSYYQYWNGYYCVDNYYQPYQPYYPVNQYTDYNDWVYYDWSY